jgi:acetyl-CoA acetyltransferase
MKPSVTFHASHWRCGQRHAGLEELGTNSRLGARVPEQPIKDRTAIAGIGWTKFSRSSGTTVLNLAAEASLNAIRDAGLSVQDIDGVITYYWAMDTIYPHELVEALGIQRCNYELLTALGGGWSCGPIVSAAMAVYAGLCKNVLVFRAANGRSDRPIPPPMEYVKGASQFSVPFGALHAAAKYGHLGTAHMARYGTTSLDFAHLAVTQRKHATLNTKAVMRSPITIEDHQQSPWVIYPARLLDCCLETDGAAAVVVTSAERARDLRHAPVYIMSIMGGTGRTADSWETNGVNAAPLLYEGAGITPSDVSIAELYDPFTYMCMLHIEDFGLVKRGEVGEWVRAGRNGLDGDTPVNTHGGLLSEAYIQGLNHVVEAVQQLRPGGVVDDLCSGPHSYDRSECRQVRDPEIALLCGETGETSLLLRRA